MGGMTTRSTRRSWVAALLVVGCASTPEPAPTGLGAIERTKRCRLTSVLDESSLGVGKSTSPYRSLSVAPDGALLVDATLVVGGRVARTFPSRPGAPVLASAFSRDGRRVLVFEGGAAGEVAGVLWDRDTGARLRALTLGRELDRGWVIAIALARDGDVALLGDSVDSLWLWRFGGPEPPRRVARSEGAFVAVSVSPDGRLGIAVDAQGSVRVYELDAGRALAPLDGPSAPWQRNPDLVAFASVEGEAYVLDESARLALRDVASGKTLMATPGVPEGQRGTSLRLSAFSPDARTLLRVAANRTSITVVALDTLAETDRLELGFELAAQAIAFSPDGRSFHVETANGKILSFELE
jgi:WD40 repeat protein